MRRCGGEWGPSSPRSQTHPSLQLVEFKMSEREVPITIAQRVVIKFLTKENVGPNEIWRRLRAQYGESTLSKTQVKFWHKEFRGGRDAVQNISHQRHPRTSITPENIAVVRDLIEGDRRLTVVEIWQELGTRISYGSLQSIIKNELLFRKIRPNGYPGCARPHSAALTKEKLAQMYWTALEHQLYSPDISPCDYHMFGPLKEALGVQRFGNDEQVKNFVLKWLQTRPPPFYNAGIEKLPIRWQKCVVKGGNYVEKGEFFYFVKLCFSKKLKAEVGLYLIYPHYLSIASISK